MIGDIFRTISYCLTLLVSEPKVLAITLAIAVVIAIGSWALCWASVHAWNKRFHMRPSHHLACLIAGLLSFFATILFSAFGYTDQAASRSLRTWIKDFQTRELTADKHGDTPMARTIFYAVDKVDPQKYDDNTPYDPETARAGDGRTRTFRDGSSATKYSVILKRQETIGTQVVTIADTMFSDLEKHRQFLSWLTVGARSRTDSRIATTVVPWCVDEMVTQQKTMSFASIIDRCLNIMESEIQDRLRRSRILSRTILVGLVLLLQGAAFGIVGHAAYRDLKVHAGRR